MAIKVIRSVTVECDDCGFSFDEFDVTPAEEMEQVRKYGGTGTYRKCWCPDCSKRREALKDGSTSDKN